MHVYRYLDAVVHLAYVLLRMLEKYSKTNAYMYVRKRKAKRARRKKGTPARNPGSEQL
jgi:replication fork protection complex subunit Tof1/Swi1